MRTEAQINASRLNGAKSNGPVTSEGKSTSSRNAQKHGILAANVLLEGENKDGFEELVHCLYEELQPATPFEESLVNMMAVASWRQQRIWNIDRVTMGLQVARECQTTPALDGQHSIANAIAFQHLADGSRALDLIHRYEARYERQYLRAHKRFIEVRDARLKSDPSPDPAPAPAAHPDAGVSTPAHNVIPIDRTPAPATQPEPAPQHEMPNEPNPAGVDLQPSVPSEASEPGSATPKSENPVTPVHN
jgi:hypothetical protein